MGMEAEFTVLREDEEVSEDAKEWVIAHNFYGTDIWHNHQEEAKQQQGLMSWWNRKEPWGKCTRVGDANFRKPTKKVHLFPCHICKEEVPEEVGTVAQDLEYLR